MRMIYIIGVADYNSPGSRGNIGAMVAERLLSKYDVFKLYRSRLAKDYNIDISHITIGDDRATVILPRTNKEEYGPAVKEYFWQSADADLNNIVVIHDDIDFSLGRFRIKVGGGDAGNNAIRSLAKSLDDKEFIRLRMGIGRGSKKMSKSEYLDQPFTAEEAEVALPMIDGAVIAIEAICNKGVKAARKGLKNIKPEAFSEKKKIPVVRIPRDPPVRAGQSIHSNDPEGMAALAAYHSTFPGLTGSEDYELLGLYAA